MTSSSLRRFLLLGALAALGCSEREVSSPAAATDTRAAAPTPGGPGQHVARRAMLEVRASFWVQTPSARATADASRSLTAFAEHHDGYVQTASLRADEAPGEMTLRVPPDALGELRATLARVGGGAAMREQVSRTDVTEALLDLDARLRVARATETRLLALLDQRGGALADVLAVERALAEQRTHIEQLESEQRSAQGRVDLATVTVAFETQVTAPDASLGQQMATAARGGVHVVRTVAVGTALFALWAGPLALLLAAIAWATSRALRRRPSALPGR